MENTPYDKDKTTEQQIEEINQQLGVHYWPGAAGYAPESEAQADQEPRPWWWHGDEEASASFLREMGVSL